jgi:cytochrome-b5 reductase
MSERLGKRPRQPACMQLQQTLYCCQMLVTEPNECRLIAGGTGIAPMIQILRSALYYNRSEIQIKLLYAAATADQLAYLPILRRKAVLHPNFAMHCAIEKLVPGLSWTEVWPPTVCHSHLVFRLCVMCVRSKLIKRFVLQHVGFINADLIKSQMFAPAEDVLIVMCGPYPMCQALKKTLAAVGYTPEMVFCYM